MAEGEGEARQPSTEAEPPRSSESPDPAGMYQPPLDRHGLLARLGEQLERHPPEDLVILSRGALERREFGAYADGWRDAVEAYDATLGAAPGQAPGHAPGQATGEVGAAPGAPRLRLVERVPEPAPVVPPRRDGRPESREPGPVASGPRTPGATASGPRERPPGVPPP
ncbi:hypothetical protein DVH02_22425, partial [Streptomyces corynorhini]